MISLPLNCTAAHIVAAALMELFPGILLLDGGAHSLGFYYEFESSYPLPAELQSLVEEKVRQIIREKRPIRVLEMVPLSARELLKKEGHFARLEAMDQTGQELVHLVQIGSFFDLSAGECVKNSHEVGAFKIQSIEFFSKGGFVISGIAFHSKDLLKDYLKKWKDYLPRQHQKIGRIKQLWSIFEHQVVWLSKGLQEMQALLKDLKKELFQEVYEVSFSGDLDKRRRMYQQISSSFQQRPFKIGSYVQVQEEAWEEDLGFFKEGVSSYIEIISYYESKEFEQIFISSLQSAQKTLNILGFEYTIQLSGPKGSDKGFQKVKKNLDRFDTRAPELDFGKKGLTVSFLVKDRMDRAWPIFAWKINPKQLFMTGWVERLYALLLERSV